MGLFSQKKKEVIPDVPQQPLYVSSNSRTPSIASSAPSYRTAPSYVPPSQGGSGYTNHYHYGREQPSPGPPPPQQQQQGGKFGAPPPLGRNPDSVRNELFAGAAKNPPPGGYLGGKQQYPYAQPPPGEASRGGRDQYGDGGQGGQMNEEDEEVEGIKQQMRFVKQESLASTRNAVRIAREAEETARATLDKLGDQSDRIANTERHLDLANAHNSRAVDETKELEALNKSIFRPNLTWNKAAKRDKEEARLLARHNQEKAEREQVRRDQYESRQRIESTYKGMDRAAENAAGARARARARGAERAQYQFEADAEDDAVEDEIDDNLNELGGLAGRLKALAMTAGQEVDAQNAKLSQLSGKVDTLDNRIHTSTARMARIK